jgi:hypothetical protein
MIEYMNIAHRWTYIERRTDVLGGHPVPVPLCPHKSEKNTYLESNPGKVFSLFIQKQNKHFLYIAVYWDYRGPSGVRFPE